MPRLQESRFAASGAELEFEMDGRPCTALEGESIAAALLAQGRRVFKRDRNGHGRGPSCGMGVCFECEVSVDGATPVRACMTPARAGMRVRSVDYRKAAPVADSSPAATADHIACDALVVGAGPAGISAAVKLADAGISVTVVDERGEPGGQYFKPLGASQRFVTGRGTDQQYRDGQALRERLRASPARVIHNATVWGAFRTAGRRL